MNEDTFSKKTTDVIKLGNTSFGRIAKDIDSEDPDEVSTNFSVIFNLSCLFRMTISCQKHHSAKNLVAKNKANLL